MSETIKELLISIKNGLESGDFEKTLDNCRTLNERKPDSPFLPKTALRAAKSLPKRAEIFTKTRLTKTRLNTLPKRKKQSTKRSRA